MDVQAEAFDDEKLVAHLQAKFVGAAATICLSNILGNFCFDVRLTDPREKVGHHVFQQVDKILARH